VDGVTTQMKDTNLSSGTPQQDLPQESSTAPQQTSTQPQTTSTQPQERQENEKSGPCGLPVKCVIS